MYDLREMGLTTFYAFLKVVFRVNKGKVGQFILIIYHYVYVPPLASKKQH